MTNDHWIQVAIGITNAIAVLAAGILTPVVASRINQPKPKLETAKPANKIRFIRIVNSTWFALGVLLLINIFGLYLDMVPVNIGAGGGAGRAAGIAKVRQLLLEDSTPLTVTVTA
jgi:hypothetical protein